MFTRLRTGLAAILLVLAFTGVSTLGTPRVFAAGNQPPGPDRYTILTVDYTSYKWWLVQWSDSSVACELFIDHDGLPTGSEIYNACGQAVYTQWMETQPCDQSDQNPSACQGEYLQLVSSSPAKRQVGVTLPPPVVWVTLQGCAPVNSTNHCDSLPSLILTGEEPLPNQHITTLGGTIDGKAFTCSAVCQLDLMPTGKSGTTLQFWAYSSYGDSSVIFDAQVRVVPDNQPGSTAWYADVLSSQWRGDPTAACSQTWQAFPPVGGPPDWLSTPQQAEDLASSIPFEYLAANLIAQGVVDTSTCPDGGQLEDGSVSACGMTAAGPAVTDWQNRFDDQIFAAALKSGVPAQLLKNIFSRESQFWPGVVANRPEVGLGQMTDNGADTTLLWNPSFYEQYCPLVLADSACKKGYAQLNAHDQAILRGALVRSVDASCSNCSLGLDLSQADFSVSVFAESLEANCEQTGTIIHNASGRSPGEVSSYEDLWRFTLTNYNAGSGCLILAVRAAEKKGDPLDWEHVSSDLTPVCQGAIDYVNAISH